MGDRDASNIPIHLRGSYVTVTGTVASLRNTNPFIKNYRHRMILLSPVIIAGTPYDHTWMYSDRNTNSVTIGDKITFFSKLGIYEHDGLYKWYPKSPYEHLSIKRCRKRYNE